VEAAESVSKQIHIIEWRQDGNLPNDLYAIYVMLDVMMYRGCQTRCTICVAATLQLLGKLGEASSKTSPNGLASVRKTGVRIFTELRLSGFEQINATATADQDL